MALTPMMQQYLDIKKQYDDCILFFRLGDFYEMFFEDAKLASRELELVLTGRDCGLKERAPMCGIPYHAVDSYIGKLIARGYKIAICEQLEDPALAKGIVKRGIIKIFTPGTYTNKSFLEENKNNYISSLYIDKELDMFSICFSDVSTGEFNCTEGSLDLPTILDEISKYGPREMLLQDEMEDSIYKNITQVFKGSITKLSPDYFKEDFSQLLSNQFEDFDSQKLDESLTICCGSLLKYIIDTQKTSLSHINKINRYSIVDYLSIDSNSRRNLELTENLREKKKRASLLWVIDKTSTAMGGRQLRRWVERPLIKKSSIKMRQDSVEEILNDISSQEDLKSSLKNIYDIERLVGRISSKSVNAKELIFLKNSIEKIPDVKSIISKFNTSLLAHMYESLDELRDIYDLIDTSIVDDPPMSVKEGNIIKKGYDGEIDELKDIKTNGRKWIANLEKSEREHTGIKSLKIGYNKVFGYFIEVTKSNLNLVPDDRYIRKQTLTNCERYITPELKEMEDKILKAEDRLINLEYTTFVKIRDDIEKQVDRMQISARIISELDCLNSLAETALENNYCKPEITSGDSISIIDGRHPVVEKMLDTGSFVANDVNLDRKNNQLLLITGPNMAGKSTYMRQTALIVILAQIGSFVPAKSASIGICDKIFTRIGASDDLSSGKSTFMVEMWEVSNILKNATNKSLVLLDEVGRGTSTYDGLSIAWSVIEYMCGSRKMKCKTLFATHYHELTRLEGKIPGVKNYSVAVNEINGEVVFLRKIVEGGADQSYGIEVAKLAGIPEKVIKRAKEILSELESENTSEPADVEVVHEKPAVQINMQDIEEQKFIKEISSINILDMTPMEGFNKLYDIIEKVKSISK